MMKILEAQTMSELLGAIDEFCKNLHLQDDAEEQCSKLKNEVAGCVDNDNIILLSAYLSSAEGTDEVAEALYEFASICGSYSETDEEITQQITKAEFEAVLDECEDKCMLETCIESEYEIKVAEIPAYIECREHDVIFKGNSICVLLPKIDINTDTKKYISDMIGGILYKIVETKIKPEEIRYEMNRYIPATRNSEESTKRLFKKYFYDVVIHKDRKPGIYLEFDDHMHQLFSIEFFKRLIVQYLRE